MAISTHTKLLKRGAPMGCTFVSLTLICSVISLGSSQAAAALSLGDTLGRAKNSSLLAPVTQKVIPQTLGAIDQLTTPVLGNTLPRATSAAGNLVNGVTGNVLPTTISELNDVLSPVTGNTVPQVLNTVNNTIQPVTNALAPTVDGALGTSPTTQPLAQSLSPFLQRGPLARITPTSTNNQGDSVAPITRPLLASLNPSFSQPRNNTSKGLQPIVSGIGGFLGFFPALLSSILHELGDKKIDTTSLLIATGILSGMLIVFIATSYRMISRAKHNIHAIGQDFLLESSMYGRLAKLSAVTFGSLGLGSVLIYFILIRM